MDRWFHLGFSLLLLCTINLAPRCYEAAPTVTITPTSPAGVERGTVSIFCKVQGTPKAQLTWYKNGTVVRNSRISKFVLPDGGMIRIAPLKQSRHQATYKCEADNGADPPVSATTKLTVYTASSTPSGFPVVTKSPRSGAKRTGHHVVLPCTAAGSPQPTISWMKDSLPLDISRARYKTQADGLRIDNLGVADQGKYECVATNDKGTVFSRPARLYVIVMNKPPTFTLTPPDKTVDPETNVELKCSAKGTPPPSIVWERQGVSLAGSTDGTLVITNIKVSGNYTCMAINSVGRVQASSFVTVRALPFSPNKPIATQITPHSITLIWQMSGGPAVVSYQLDYRKKGHTVWYEVDIRDQLSWTVSNLKPYETYEFRVFASNDLGSSKSSPVAEFVTSQKAPGSAPHNIIARGASDTSFRAKWAPPDTPNGKILGYRLYYTTDMNDDPKVWRFMASSINKTVVQGLVSRTTYYIRVLAYNKAGAGPLSEVLAVKTQKGVPSQPQNVKVKVTSSTAIVVTWQQPLYKGDGIFGYEIYYNKTSKDMDTNVAAIDTFTKNIMGLRPFTFYKIGVAAKSDKGVGPVSFSAIARTDEDAPSDSPKNVLGKSKDSTSLEISWDPPPLEHRNGIITDYIIKCKPKGGQTQYYTVDGHKTSFVLHNLKKFTNYFVWVRANTKVGKGPFTDKYIFSTAEDVPSGAPRQLDIKVVNSSVIDVSWRAPSSNQDGRILGYMVFYRKVDDQGNPLKPPAQEQMKDSLSENKLKVSLTDLEAETMYQIEVAGYTIKGDGARSATKFGKTHPRRPDAPFVYSRIVNDGGDVEIGWRTSAKGVIGYRVRYGKSLVRMMIGGRNNVSIPMRQISLGAGNNKKVFKGLGQGLWYLVAVSLETKAGWSPEKLVWVNTPPGPPTGPPLNVKSSPKSSTELEVTWREPHKWKRNGPIVGYSVLYKELHKGSAAKVKNITNPNQTKVVLQKLKKYTQYEIRVQAIGAVGLGPPSNAFKIQTKQDVPGPPSEVGVKAMSTSVVLVTWKAPQLPNGIITGYKISYSEDDRIPFDQWSSQRATGLSAQIRNLSKRQKYWFRVAAKTFQDGEYSDEVSVTTLEYDLPGFSRDITTEKLTSSSVVLKWLAPEIDAGIEKYLVQIEGTKSYKDNGNIVKDTHKENYTISAASQLQQVYTLNGLRPAMKYNILVIALNAMGAGPAVEVTIKTKKGKPQAVSRPVVEKSGITERYIPVKIQPVAPINGEVSYYIVVVVPLGPDGKLPRDRSPDDYFPRVKRRKAVIEKPYIAAKFMAEQLPDTFNVGDSSYKNQFGYYNKPLVKGLHYTIFTRAYVKTESGDVVYKSSPFIEPIKFGILGNAAGRATTGASQDPGEAKGGLPLGLIVGPIIGVVVIAGIVFLIVFLLRRKKRRHGKGKGKKEPRSHVEKSSEPSDPVELRRLAFQTPAMIDHPPISVADLAKHIVALKADNCAKFTKEYESIEPGQTFTSDQANLEINKQKNRYPNILAYDSSRVRLSTNGGKSGSDYINANFCDGYRKEHAYIATQGPTTETVTDFWRMIWEQRTFTIVMLTRLEERGRSKCDRYFPEDEEDQIFGDIEVSLQDWVELANYTITTLQISKINSNLPPREVKHFQFMAWPDHGVPSHPTPFLAFLRRVKFYNPPDAGPITVHCSAGVGRTGCFIVVDSMLERIKHEHTVDIYGHVTVLRTQRNYMVQTQEQYVFIHEALLEAVSCGNTEVHARNLLHHIKKITELQNGETTGLEEEFKRLVDPSQARFHRNGAGAMACNRSKNRLANILPYETTRVRISPIRGVEGSDYINANFIDGYSSKDCYIATQGPLQETVDDFWRMIMEHNSNIIVMLSQLYENDREKCFQYWPEDRSARHQYFIVDPVAEQEFPQFVMRDFKVKDARNDRIRNIKQFHFFGWPESGVPKSGEGIIDLIGQVQRVYEQQEEEGPITVHCSDGVGRTGVFCALGIVLERMRSEGVVDLFQTVKLLRTQRPGLVQTQEQYLFCYKTALEYLGSFDHYAI